MAKLILSLEGQTLGEYPLDKERITLGRKPHNDIHIDNLAVSGDHAAITTLLSDSFLEDLDSTNGTLVNGQPIKKHHLQSGDVIEIGKYRLMYLPDGATAPLPVEEGADFEKTMIIRSPVAAAPAPSPGDGQGMDMDATHAAMPAYQGEAPPHAPQAVEAPHGEPLPVAAIQVLTGANAGKELDLTKTLTSLGKPGVQVAVITRRPQGYFITHVQGAQFPVLNGQPLDAQAHLLHDHDVIEIAGVKMEFFLK